MHVNSISRITNITHISRMRNFHFLHRVCPHLSSEDVAVVVIAPIIIFDASSFSIRAQIFERIREVSPVQLKKIRLIKGDIAKDNLDIDSEDESEMTKTLDVIFHCAAKAKFSLTLRQALSFNTIGTLRVLQLASRVKHLMVFSHVSTSYCFPQKTILEERYYEPAEDPYRVIELLASKHKADLDDAEPR